MQRGLLIASPREERGRKRDMAKKEKNNPKKENSSMSESCQCLQALTGIIAIITVIHKGLLRQVLPLPLPLSPRLAVWVTGSESHSCSIPVPFPSAGDVDLFWLEQSGHRRDHLLLVLACFALVSFPEKGSEFCHCNNSQRGCWEHTPLIVHPRTAVCHLKAHYPWLTLSSCLHVLKQQLLTKSLPCISTLPKAGVFILVKPQAVFIGSSSAVVGSMVFRSDQAF